MFDRDYGYDTAGNLTTVTDLINASLNQGFGYDALSRLTSETGQNTLSLVYDSNGNRTQQITTFTQGYTYDPNSNKLTQVGSQATTTYDPMGNTLSRTTESTRIPTTRLPG